MNDKYSNMNIITADFNWISLLVIVIVWIIGMMRSKTKKTVERPVFFPPEYDTQEDEKEEGYTVSDFSDRKEESWIAANTARESEVTIEPSKSAMNYRPFENTPVFQDDEEKEEEPIRIDLRQAIISSEILRRPDF